MKTTPILIITAALLLCCLFSGIAEPAAAEEQPVTGSGDFKISSIVICDPQDPLCKPCLFFKTGQSIRINVLQNYGKDVIEAAHE
ncbi:MAG: hypothetical protein AB9903_01710, partial [Vulcanimicrobiota bacterium]